MNTRRDEQETEKQLRKELQLYVKRFRAPENTRLGWVIQYLKSIDCEFNLEVEVQQFLMARFLVPAVEHLHPDEDIKKYVIECIALFDAYSQILRGQYGIPAVAQQASGRVFIGDVVQSNDDGAANGHHSSLSVNGQDQTVDLDERASFSQHMFGDEDD